MSDRKKISCIQIFRWIDAGLPKYIYLSPPLISPTTYNGIRTKNCPVWITPGAAPIRWMQGPIRGGGDGAPGTRPPPKIEKNMIFWRKIVIFHMKYPKNFRTSLRNFLTSAPLTCNPGSAPGMGPIRNLAGSKSGLRATLSYLLLL